MTTAPTLAPPTHTPRFLAVAGSREAPAAPPAPNHPNPPPTTPHGAAQEIHYAKARTRLIELGQLLTRRPELRNHIGSTIYDAIRENA